MQTQNADPMQPKPQKRRPNATQKARKQESRTPNSLNADPMHTHKIKKARKKNAERQTPETPGKCSMETDPNALQCIEGRKEGRGGRRDHDASLKIETR